MHYEEITSKSKFSFNWKELVQYQELFYFFTLRDIKVKYKQTALGFAWAIIQPVIMALIFSFFFSSVIAKEENLALPYPVFVLIGMIAWNAFSTSLSNSAQSMINNANIIKKIYFPRLIIPISSILVSLVDFTISLIVIIPFILYYKVVVYWWIIICIPVSILLLFFTSLGIGSFLGALNVKYRDFRYILPFLIQLLLFVSPVIYPLSMAKNKYLQFILSLNPISTALDIFRMGFQNNIALNASHFYSLIVALVLLFGGLYYFRKTESYFADIA